MTSRVKYLSLSVADQLYESVYDNLDRYKIGDFNDLPESGGWSAELSLFMEDDLFSKLIHEKSPGAEFENSIIIWKALENIPPSVATEGRVWMRLAHIECLGYCRARWLSGVEEEDLEDVIKNHFFAFTLTQYRDDHAISRLWWNYYIASRVYPDDPTTALKVILKRADIRSNFIERPWVSSRINLARGIINKMIIEPWITESQINYREFMKAVNKIGSGVVFEVLNELEIDKIMNDAQLLAEKNIENIN